MDRRVAMTSVARVLLPSGTRTHTVIDDDGLPVAPIEEYLAFLRHDQASPHTVQAYARGLSSWWCLLADQGLDWRDFPTGAFGSFLAYLRTGDLPSVRRVGPEPTWLAPASVTQRSAAVLAASQITILGARMTSLSFPSGHTVSAFSFVVAWMES